MHTSQRFAGTSEPPKWVTSLQHSCRRMQSGLELADAAATWHLSFASTELIAVWLHDIRSAEGPDASCKHHGTVRGRSAFASSLELFYNSKEGSKSTSADRSLRGTHLEQVFCSRHPPPPADALHNPVRLHHLRSAC